MRSSQLLFILFISFCFYLNDCKTQSALNNRTLQLIATIPLSNVNGRIDHLAFDKKRQLIFVAALGNNTIEVVDLKTKNVVYTINDLRKPQGVAFIPESNTLVVTNGRTGACDIFNAETFQKKSTVQLSSDADNIRYDSASKKIFVGYGSGGIAIIDAMTFKLVSDIKLSGHPESFHIDKSANKIYVNVPDEKRIEIINLESNLVTDQWKMSEAISNFPMALDETNHRLFVGCRYNPKLLIIDTQTGKTISSLDIDKDVDDIFFDNVGKRIYLSCGAGFVDVFKQIDANHYKSVERVVTFTGARTSILMPELNELIVASPSGVSNSASLLIYSLQVSKNK